MTRNNRLNMRPGDYRSLACLSGAVYLLASIIPVTQAADWSTRPLQGRVGTNLVENPEFNGTGDWFLRNGAAYDGSVSRSAGSGSIKIQSSGDKVETYGAAWIPVTPGGTYTFSAQMMSQAPNGWPPPMVRMYYRYRSATGLALGSPYYNGRWGNSTTDAWEEITGFVEIPEEINGTPVEKVSLEFFVANDVEGVYRDIWLDDVYFGQGKGFEQPAAPKTPFDGTQTRIDDLGNMEILRNGTTWEPFFPLAIAGDGHWSTYANQGFNVEARAWSTDLVNVVRQTGMMSGYDITGYMVPGNPKYNDLAGLSNVIATLKSQNMMDDIAFFYWDNEQNAEWSVQQTVTNLIHQEDVDAGGNRLHPIFTVNATIGHARRHQNDTVHFSDITGTYIGDDLGNAHGRTDEFIILDNIQNQRQPAVFAQINRGVGLELRPRLFGAIAHGAKGLSFWRDYNGDVTGLPWWSDFPNMADEINQMMDAGLIQQPHWTEWSIDTPAKGIDFGTRDLDGEGYLIAANYNDAVSVVTFTLNGLGYTPVEVRDFFTDAVVATLTGNQFDVTLGANDSGVYRLVADPTNPGDFDGDGDVDGTDFLTWQRGESPGGATAADLAEWQTCIGTIYSSTASAEPVPEPGTLLLMLAGAVFWGETGRKRADPA